MMHDMTVTLDEVRRVFDDLIAARITRAEAEAWALERMQAEDERRLKYSPESEEKKIWEGVLYLLGVDSRVSPHEHLHTNEDFQKFRKEKGL